MELSALTITGARPMRASLEMSDGVGSGDLRAAWLTRLPSVGPGAISEAYRSFRAQEGAETASLPPALAVAPPLVQPPATGQPPVLTGTLPAAFAAYGETMAE